MPIYALNQSTKKREWLVPGLLKDKVIALVKSLPGRPRSRLLPLPDYAQAFIDRTPFAGGGLLDTLLADVRNTTQLNIKRADFKLGSCRAICS